MKSRNKIAKTLLIYILLFSGIVTICTTAFQLQTEYNRDIDNIEGQFNKIEEIFKPALAQALWFFNEESIKIQLEGMSQLGDIEYIELIDDENRSTMVGEKQSEHPLTRHIPLLYNPKGKWIEVGTLTVVASKTKIYKRLFERLIIVLLSQGVKIFLVSIFIFLLVHFLVTKHLGTIDTYLNKIYLDNPSSLLELQRRSSLQGDELDQMVASINEMTEQLHMTYEKIERTVKERTAELSKANEQIKVSLKEKEALIKEVYHRTKNNMQVIISMLHLRTQNIEDDNVLEIFKEIENRIKTMALVHEKLYQTKDLSRIDLKEYFNDLLSLLKRSYKDLSGGIRINTDMDSVSVTIDYAIPCGLIINELISNSFKHAFSEEKKGEIMIGLKSKDDGEIEILVADDGVGMPEGVEYRETDSLGMQTIISLTEHQLQGKLVLNTDKGTEFRIRFKQTGYEERV